MSARSTLYPTAIFVSILLSCVASLRGAVINPDAICYLQSAETIGASGLHTAMQICGQAAWPFYSVLIFSVVSLLKLSFTTAAFALDGVFSLVSVISFIYITRLLGASQRVQWLAAAVILLAHEFNSVREYIIRDHGFWACYLVSIAFLIQYCRTPQWRYAAGWSVAMLLAVLFRVEGVIFLVCVPAVVWFLPTLPRLRAFLQLNAMTIALGLLVLTGVMFSSHSSRLAEIQFQLTHGISALTQHFKTTSDALAQHVLNTYSARDANLLLFLLLVAWYSVSVITNLSVIYGLLVIYACWHKTLSWDKPARTVLCAYVLVNVLITAPFLVEYLFLAKRYLIALSLVLMLAVPFALDHLIHKKQKRWLFLVVVLMLFNSLGGIIDFGYSKTYIRDAGEWLSANTDAKAAIYSNDEQVLYYSGHFGNTIFEKIGQPLGDWHQYDYIALRSTKNTHTTIPINPVTRFSNKRGDEVAIYKIPR